MVFSNLTFPKFLKDWAGGGDANNFFLNREYFIFDSGGNIWHRQPNPWASTKILIKDQTQKMTDSKTILPTSQSIRPTPEAGQMLFLEHDSGKNPVFILKKSLAEDPQPKQPALKEEKKLIQCKRRKPHCKEVIRLSQADFNSGMTVVLEKPNTTYLLTEDVKFRPATNMEAVQIGADNIVFDLGCHTMSGSGNRAIVGISLERTTGPSGPLQNIYIHNGTIRGFRIEGIDDVSASINLTLKHLTISYIGSISSTLFAFGIFSNGATNFSISHCKIYSVNSTDFAGGIVLFRSTGTLRKCKVSTINSSKNFAVGAEIYNDALVPQQVQVSSMRITSIKGTSTSGLLILSFLGRGGFESSYVHDVIVDGVYSTAVANDAVGVEVIHAQKLALRHVCVKNVTATVTSDTPLPESFVFGFRVPFSNVSFDDCNSNFIDLAIV